MMRLPMIWAIARAEIRSTRRLTRYWVFAILSVFIAFVMYMQYAAIHGFASNISATVGAMGPRYLVTSMGMYLLIVFLLGLIFLAFDVRARDVRERMAEVLDSRPVSNAELLLGRVLGLVIMAWLPVLFTAILLQSFGGMALLFDWPIGEPVEPYSLLGFTLNALAAFILWCAVIVLLAVLLKNRLLVALAALSLFALQVWGFLQLPIYLQSSLSFFSSFVSASDLVPTVFAGGLPQKLAMLILAAGLIALATGLHPRRDSGARSRKLLLGGGLVALGCLAIGVMTLQTMADIDRAAAWLAVHVERSNDPRVDLAKLSGSVTIEPGNRLELNLEIAAQTPADDALETILFTFNPGLSVEAITVNGEIAHWRHESGLLEIMPSSTPAVDSNILIGLKAGGAPDTTFGYLDSATNLIEGGAMDAQLGLLGVEVSVFSADYVALMPGSRWLPSPGTDVPLGDPRTHPADFFEIDLEVTVPAQWLVAGPGRRQPIEDDGERASFRFAPAAVVPMVGLIAARFERRAMTVSGVEFELLVHPGHDRNLIFFDDIGAELETRLADVLDTAKRLGMAYPYGGFSLVETPNNLRGYGGGWRMDTVQSLPGMMLMRESSFPTARFESRFNTTERFEELEGGIARAKVEALENFFENDVSGGNLFLGGSRNFLLYQTGSRGDGALAMDFVLDELMNRLLMDKEGFFSAHMFDQQSGFMVGQTIANMVSGQANSVAQSIHSAATDRPSVWDLALGTALADLEPASEPKQTLNVLSLKSRAIARSILDGIGREKLAAVLAEILQRYRGRHFEVADFERIASELDVDLAGLIGDWLHESSLPGFITSPVTVQRLADDRWGEPVYQTRLHIRNDEPTPGLVQFTYKAKADKDKDMSEMGDRLEPLRIAGNQSLEVGILSSSPIYELWLRPYFALNRHDVQLTLPKFDAVEQVATEAFLGGRPSTWRPARTGDIIIDDLDAGFSVVNSGSAKASDIGGGPFSPQVDMDQGLPEAMTFFGSPPVWSRQESPTSFGKYRHTIAMVRRGEGEQRAIFTATLPRAGKWRLAYHLPEKINRSIAISVGIGGGGAQARVSRGPRNEEGTKKIQSRVSRSYDLKLVTDTEIRPLEFDGAAAESGWNTLGDFDLPAGVVRIEVSDAISAGEVIADAIRWRPLTIPQTQQQAQR